MKIKVLVVEDNRALNENIVDMLEMEGYIPFGVTDMEGAKEVIPTEKPHLILLDIMLPDGSGYNLIPFIRKNYDARILMITALSDSESKRICYENGADDYISKPFDLEELIYKLRAIKRRIISSMREFHVGDIIFNIDSNELMCKGKKVMISLSQIRLLKLLYEKYEANSYLDKKEIFNSELDESHRIQMLVGRLRDNLVYVGSKEVTIETLYSKGYKLSVI